MTGTGPLDIAAKAERGTWRRRGRVLVVLLASTAAVLAVMGAVNAHLARIVRDVAPDPSASLRVGRLQYCPVADDPCCDAPADRACLLAFESEGGSLAQRDIVVWLALDVLFAMLYAAFVALACRWTALLLGFPRRWGGWFAAIAVTAALADIVENGALLLVLRSVGETSPGPFVALAQWVAWGCGKLKLAIIVPLAALAIAFAWRGKPIFWRHMVYFAVLRPSFVFAAVLLYLPLSAIETAPLSSMLGNLLVDYGFWKGFWLGLVLFPTVWSLMFTTCLLLDSERTRDPDFVHAPPDDERTVTLPITDGWVFGAFTTIALPTLVVVTWTAAAPPLALVGTVLGGLVAYAGLDLSMSVLWRNGANLRSLPWQPVAARHIPLPVVRVCERFTEWFRGVASRGARWIGMPGSMFNPNDPALLEDDHVFAAWSLTAMLVLYVALSVALAQVVRTNHFGVLYALPPAGFLYVLLVWFVWVVSLVWFVFRRYRLALAAIVLAGLFLYTVSNQRGSKYTFEATKLPAPAEAASAGSAPLTAQQILAPLRPGDPIIIVAASGGGIAAAGWTTKVLAELRERIPDFDRKLRLVSTVSGGSVGSAHYLNAAERARVGQTPFDREALRRVISASMDTSLSATAYGFAFPELHRLVFPWVATELSDRGRLQERSWQWRADCGAPKGPRRLSDLSAGVVEGRLPAVIFNTTLLETGGRVAVTNVAAIAEATATPRLRQPPRRWLNPRSLSELLNHAADGPYWTVDLWTGARLSATFSYVSPAAAVFGGEAGEPTARHLVDGGYHDNFGVASALDWLEQASPALGDRRIALIEIRASPQDEATKPVSGLAAEWLGPVLGMWNAWWRSQTETNDTALNRLVGRYGDRFQTFLFAPESEPPLSWHLSRAQQQGICDAWAARPLRNSNQTQLKALLSFLAPEQPDSETPLDVIGCDLPDPCGP